MKLRLLFILPFLSLGCLTGCGGPSDEFVTSINFYKNPSNYNVGPNTKLVIGEKSNVAIDVTPRSTKKISDVDVTIKSGSENISYTGWYNYGYLVGYTFTALKVGTATVCFKANDGSNISSKDLTFEITEGDCILTYDSMMLKDGENNNNSSNSYFDRYGSHQYNYSYVHLFGSSSNKAFYFKKDTSLGTNVFSNFNKYVSAKIVLKNPAYKTGNFFCASSLSSGYDAHSFHFNKGDTEAAVSFNANAYYFYGNDESVLIDRIVLYSDVQH